MTTAVGQIQPVILSGGSGTRLWPLSREDRPKQFLCLTGDGSMLQLTVQRVPPSAGFLTAMIVANIDHESEVRRQLSAIGVDDAALILEPAPRNTAAAIALAALSVDPEQPILVMPSDHVIADAARFRESVYAALPLLGEGYLLTFGINPDAPQTGFGYIKRGQRLTESAFCVDRFVEKPDLETARSYLAEGGHSWNAGIFLFRAGDFLSALEAHAPDVLAACQEATRIGAQKGQSFYPDAGAFGAAPSISVDYAVMEKAERVAVSPIDVGWSDIGSWDALYEYSESAGNGSTGGSVEIDSSGCLIRSDGPLIATIGVHDLIVIATSDAVLVMSRGESQRVRDVVELLKERAG